MIGADTNVLARLLLADDAGQAEVAGALLDRATQGPGLFISAFVLLELAWLLKSKKYSKEAIAEALEKIVLAPGVKIGNHAAVMEALARFKAAPAAVGFADCLIVADTSEAGAQLHTFDKDLCGFDSRCRAL